jgi:hypothetical protein
VDHKLGTFHLGVTPRISSMPIQKRAIVTQPFPAMHSGI